MSSSTYLLWYFRRLALALSNGFTKLAVVGCGKTDQILRIFVAQRRAHSNRGVSAERLTCHQQPFQHSTVQVGANYLSHPQVL